MTSENRFGRTKDLGIGLQHFRYSKPLSFPEHTHSEVSIVVCLTGSLESTQFGCREVLEPGMVLVTNRHVPHGSRYGVSGPLTEGLTLDLDETALARLGISPEEAFMGRSYLPGVADLAAQLAGELSGNGWGRDFMMSSLSAQIVVRVLRSWPRELIQWRQNRGRDVLPRQEFVQTVERMQWDESDLDRMLAGTTLSRKRFEELFANSTNATVEEYRQRLREE